MLNRAVRQFTSKDFLGGSAPAEADTLSFGEIATFLRGYLPLIAVSTVSGVAIAAAYALSATAIYTAHAQILIDPRISQIQREHLGDSEPSLPLDTAHMESQLTLLRSEGIARAVVASLDLTRDPDFQAAHASTEPGKLREAISRFRASLSVWREGVSHGINIAFSATAPEKAARIANAIAKVYVQDQLETRRQAVQTGSRWLEDRIAFLRHKMNAAARTIQEFKASRDYRLLPDPLPAARAGALSESAKDTGITLEQLESTEKTYLKLYESYLQAYTDAIQRGSYPVSNARVISQALPPVNKSHPQTRLILALGALIGLMLGTGAALIRNSLCGLTAAPFG